MSFNALCALGFSSTNPPAVLLDPLKVSMHSVLWGSLQRVVPQFSSGCVHAFQCTLCFGVLFNLIKKNRRRYVMAFQCTLCFGVLFNRHWRKRRRQKKVSMHSVLWGSLQRSFRQCLICLALFQCTLCFGVLFNYWLLPVSARALGFNALCALGFSSTS